MDILINIVISIVAIGVTGVVMAFAVAAPEKDGGSKYKEIFQQALFFALVALELYLIWWD